MKTEHDFTVAEQVAIAHALDHLRQNKIADDNYPHSGWYQGDRTAFIARHKKAMEVLEDFLKNGDRKQVRAEARETLKNG